MSDIQEKNTDTITIDVSIPSLSALLSQSEAIGAQTKILVVVIKVLQSSLIVIGMLIMLIIASFFDEEIINLFKTLGTSLEIEHIALFVSLLGLILVSVQTYYAYRAISSTQKIKSPLSDSEMEEIKSTIKAHRNIKLDE